MIDLTNMCPNKITTLYNYVKCTPLESDIILRVLVGMAFFFLILFIIRLGEEAKG